MIIFNTAPFWASLLAYLLLSEKLKLFEFIAMVVSFVGIILIAVAKPVADPAAIEDPIEGEEGLSDSAKKLIGVGCVIITAWIYAIVTVQTRMMQGLKASIVLTYYACFAVSSLTIVLLIETWIQGQPLRILTTSWEQLGMMFVVSFINVLGLNFQTIAAQNERSGLITLIGYVGIFYAFLGDLLLFKVQFGLQEILAASLILVVNLTVIIRQLFFVEKEVKDANAFVKVKQ